MLARVLKPYSLGNLKAISFRSKTVLIILFIIIESRFSNLLGPIGDNLNDKFIIVVEQLNSSGKMT